MIRKYYDIGPKYQPAGSVGGGGSPQNLQQVTDTGNTTTDEIAMNGVGSYPAILLAPSGGTPYINFYNTIENLGFQVGMNPPGGGTPGGAILFYNNSGSNIFCIQAPVLFGNVRVTFRNKAGVIALLSDLPHGNYTAVATTGQTVFNIPHGLTYTPTFASIVAKNAPTATILAGGYYLAYTGTNIVLTLLVPVAGVAFNASIDWNALQ